MLKVEAGYHHRRHKNQQSRKVISSPNHDTREWHDLGQVNYFFECHFLYLSNRMIFVLFHAFAVEEKKEDTEHLGTA